MKLSDINTNTKEGQLLLAALVIITTECRTDKTPEDVLAELSHIYSKMKIQLADFQCYRFYPASGGDLLVGEYYSGKIIDHNGVTHTSFDIVSMVPRSEYVALRFSKN